MALRNEPWCEGAEPAERTNGGWQPRTEILYLRPGRENTEVPVVAEIRPDAQGRFSVALAPKQAYCVLTSDQLEPAKALPGPEHWGFDADCLERHWRRCAALIELGAEAPDELRLKLHGRCEWEVPCASNAPAPPG